MVTVRNLKKSFALSREQLKAQKKRKGRFFAVDDISFDAQDGRILALLGPNGAGKTTTLRCIAALIRPDAGAITVNGVDGLSDPFGVRRKLCFLTSELKLDDYFTADYLVGYYAKLHGLGDEAIERTKRELFDELGVETFKHVKIGKMSSGMKQKTMIALNLIHDPEVIVFDEPTNGLDILTARSVTDYIARLRDKGKTIILSTHIMEVAQRVSDRIAIMLDGKIVVDDALDGILQVTGTKTLDDAFFEVYRTHKRDKDDA